MSASFHRFFGLPVAVSLLALAAVFVWGGGWEALLTAALLTILEVTLSFDNAVVNARVLVHMSAVWRKRFLTWGLLVAVFGTRLVLPILIVAASAALSPLAVAAMALFDPEGYGHLLEGTRLAINAFGGTFLLMVALKYFFDDAKTVHWIQMVERRLSRWGRIEAVEIGIALLALLLFSFFSAPEEQTTILFAGVIGITLFIFVEGIASAFSVDATAVGTQSAVLFIYLNVLDSAFSLDSVVGAFALTNSLIIIAVGLGIGAYFVRALTVYMVERRTLESLVYLEHGAHWAIFGLAASMYAGLFLEVPELITGTIGLAFVTAAYYSSLRVRAHPDKPEEVRMRF